MQLSTEAYLLDCIKHRIEKKEMAGVKDSRKKIKLIDKINKVSRYNIINKKSNLYC